MSQPRPQHMSPQAGSLPSTAKVRLLTQLLDRAGQLGLSLATQAVLARIAVDTWWSPDDRAWVVRQRQDATARRLGGATSVRSVRRYIDELAQHGLLVVMPGNGQLATSYRLPDAHQASSDPQVGAREGGHPWPPPTEGVATHGHPGWPPVATLPDTHVIHKTAAAAGAVRPDRIGAAEPSSAKSGQLSAAAAGGDAQEGPNPARPARDLWGGQLVLASSIAQRTPTRRQRAVAAAIAVRPRWLASAHEWFDNSTCMSLALLPHVDRLHLWRALRATHSALAGLRKPAAVVLTRLRHAPDPWQTAAEAERQLDQYLTALQVAIDQLGIERIGIKHDPHAWLQRVEASNAVMQEGRTC
jgi:hypothetical protein